RSRLEHRPELRPALGSRLVLVRIAVFRLVGPFEQRLVVFRFVWFIRFVRFLIRIEEQQRQQRQLQPRRRWSHQARRRRVVGGPVQVRDEGPPATEAFSFSPYNAPGCRSPFSLPSTVWRRGFSSRSFPGRASG